MRLEGGHKIFWTKLLRAIETILYHSGELCLLTEVTDVVFHERSITFWNSVRADSFSEDWVGEWKWGRLLYFHREKCISSGGGGCTSVWSLTLKLFSLATTAFEFLQYDTQRFDLWQSLIIVMFETEFFLRVHVLRLLKVPLELSAH